MPAATPRLLLILSLKVSYNRPSPKYWRLKDSEGGLPGLVGWWPTQAVTFIENHDTESGQWAFPEDKIMQGYVYSVSTIK